MWKFGWVTRMVALGAMCGALTAPAKEITKLDFETNAQVDEVRAVAGKNCEIATSSEVAHSGKRSLAVRPTLLGAVRGMLPTPKDATSGVITLWVFDPLFTVSRTISSHFNLGVSLCGNCRGEDGKAKWFDFSLSDGRERGYWYLSHGDTYVGTGIRRHPGWTRFDIVVEPDGPDKAVIGYIDGREAARKPAPGFKIAEFAAQTFWGAGTILVDDYAFNDDPASFRPAAVQKISAGDEANRAALVPGQELELSLLMEKKGAAAPKGVVEIELRDARERSIGVYKREVDWSALKDAKIVTTIPAPPTSRHYWVTASYREGDATEPMSATTDKIDVQLLPDAELAKCRGSVRFATPWDWQPADRDKLDAPPKDWSKAQKIRDLWFTNWERTLKEHTMGWYRREVSVPKEWSGRRTTIWIEQPQTWAKVFINGAAAGEIEWPGGEIDLTGTLKAGEKNELAILVDGMADTVLTKAVKAILGEVKLDGQWWAPKDARGLGGEVSLRAMPVAARISSVVIDTSVKDKTLRLAFDCASLPKAGAFAIKGSVSKGGKIVKIFSSTSFAAGADAKGVTIDVPWDDPELWDLWAPNLYDLNAALVDAKGATLDVMPPERFGFREVAFDRTRVTINGNPVNLFMPMPLLSHGCRGMSAWMDGANLNYLSNEHTFYYWWGGAPTSTLADDHYAFCDEAGYGSDLGLNDANLRKFLVNQLSAKGANLLDDTTYWPAFERVVRHAVKRYGNHPGLFFLNGGGGGGQLEMGCMFNPLKMDGIWLKRFDDRPVMRAFLAAETKAKALVKSLDPRHNIIAQDSGNFQDAIHITHYAGFMAIQEMIEQDSHWLANGVKPFMISEQAAPMPPNDWCDHTRKRGHGTRDPINCIAEKSAITKGDKAFHRQTVDQLELDQFEQRCTRILDRKQPERGTTEPPLGPLFAYYRDPALPSVVWDVSEERAREQWLNWRADGIGLLNNWASMGSTIKNWKPLDGFIVGTVDARTDKTHILTAGETWERGFLVLNNRRTAAKVKCSSTAELDGKEIESDAETLDVPPGGQTRVPIIVKMPKLDKDGFGTLKVELKEKSETIATERLDFEVLAPAKPLDLKAHVAVVDPEGDSATALRRLGLKFQRLNLNADFTPYDVVIFGRKAFSYESKVGATVDLAALTATGKKVLILEQEDEILRQRFCLRTDYLSPRNAYGRAGILHPVLADLPDRLLAYWRGEATLTDGYEIARSQPMEAEHNGARWFYVWNDGQEPPRPLKWGNRHNVATVVAIKPERGNFRTLVDCEYGLNYAAVWEVEQGSGRIVFNQMDVSGRSVVEPAADRLLGNLVSYLAAAPAPAWTNGAAYVGGPKGAELIEKLGVVCKTLTQPSELKPGAALVVGEMEPAELAKWKDAIAAHVAAGATCLSLPKPADGFAWLPFPVQAKEELVDAIPVADSKLTTLRGVSNGDLYFKGRLSLAAITAAPKGSSLLKPGVLAEIPHGKGRYVLCQVWPESFDVKARFYLEESRRLSYRFVLNLLNNIGVQMAPTTFLKPATKAETAAIPPLELASAKWLGLKAKPGETATPDAADPRWKPVKIPGYPHDQSPDWKAEDGALFWYRCEFDVPKLLGEATVFIGAVKDEDDAYLNGKQIGHTGRDTNINDWLLAPRYYPAPVGVIKEGRNELLLKVICLGGKSGITAGPTRILWGAAAAAGESTTAQLAKLPPIDLAGQWRGAKGAADEKERPADGDPRWHPIRVPGEFQGQHGEWASYNGLFWYTRNFDLKAIPEGARPVLVLGSVDDEDDTFINGQKIGHTGQDTNPKDYWMAMRVYPIPPGLLKQGTNTIVVRNNDIRGSGGIATAPAQITWLHPDEAAKARLAASPYLFEATRGDDPYCYNGW